MTIGAKRIGWDSALLGRFSFVGCRAGFWLVAAELTILKHQGCELPQFVGGSHQHGWEGGL